MTAYRRLSLIIVLFALIATCSATAVFCAGNGSEAYAADGSGDSDSKLEYVPDGEFYYAYNGTSAAVYFGGKFDTTFLFRFVGVDADGLPVDVTSFNPYIDNLFGNAQFFVIRPEDGVYAEYVSAPVIMEVNTIYEELIRLPYAQQTYYNGSAVEIDRVAFTLNEQETTIIDVGEYVAALQYESAENTIIVPFEIVRPTVSITPVQFTRAFGEEGEPTEIIIYGNLSEDDYQYIRDNTVLYCDLPKDAAVGEYKIFASYSGNDPNFDVVENEGAYVVTRATFTGFKFEGLDIAYDGRPHRLTLEYDKKKWDGVNVRYNMAEATEAGKYHYRCTVSKENYDDLVLEAVLLIRTPYLESTNLINYVQISGSEKGYDPDIQVTLVSSSVAGLNRLVAPLLEEQDGYKETIIASYDVSMLLDGMEVTPDEDTFSIRIRLSGLESATGVRILRYSDGELFEEGYTFENGYFVIETSSLDGFVFVKSFEQKENSSSNFIVAILIGAALVIIMLAIIGSSLSGGKSKAKWRKRHSRWI